MLLRDALAKHSDGATQLDGSGLLLAQCRSELAEALDEQEDRVAAAGWRERFSPARLAARLGASLRWALSFHPAWSTAVLLVAGALGGTVVRAWYSETGLPLPGGPAMTVSAAPRLTDQELETMGIQGIHVEPQDGRSAAQVDVQLLSQQPVNVQGTLDDADIRRLLIYVVQDGQRFDPGVRLDAMDALRARAGDPEVLAALCEAARQDDNPAVRLKALEIVDGQGGKQSNRAADEKVQQMLLGALSEDDNAGVRIAAVNALLAGMDIADGLSRNAPDSHMLDVLRDRRANDTNSYVRLRSATALARLASAGADSAVPDSSGARP